MQTAETGFSEAITQDIRVTVKSRYLPERSNPVTADYLFTYDVTISNESPKPVRLLTRHWIISDAFGDQEEVEGVGVVGETPVLSSGESHTYTSYCPLHTVFGTMHGSYGMVRDGGKTFRVQIAAFTLAVPTAVQ